MTEVNQLAAWCMLNGIDIDTRLSFGWDPISGIGVYSKELYIPAHTKLVRIPKHAVLSTKSCTLAEYIPPSPYGLGAQLALSLALYIEILKGKFSKWSGYLQSLYRNVVDIPVFWELELDTGESSRRRSEDGREALQWLKGTEAAKLLQRSSEDNKHLIDELRDYGREVVEPFIFRHKTKIISQLEIVPTLHGFYRAYSLVSSRAFVVDAYHGLCMVPVADAFNHDSQHHVHLESDYHVCPECGSLHECSHDRADSLIPTSSVTRVEVVDEDDYHMVSVTDIPPGVEVFNAYGEMLTNAQLLTRYGFILEANDYDALTWDVEEILDCVSSEANEPVTAYDIASILHHWKRLCQEDWTLVSGSSLVYIADAEPERDYPLIMNGDCKISHQLWIVIALFSFNRKFASCPDDGSELLLARLRNLLDLQSTYVEFEDESDAESIDCNSYDPALLQELGRLCKLMIRLCTDRKSKTGLVTVSDIGEYFDTLPDDRTRTKMALSVVLNELSLLNNCQATWSELLQIVVRESST